MKMHGGWYWPDADEYMVKELRADGTYQRDHLDAAMRFVTDKRIAVDGGAHVGQFSRQMSALFETVIAAEPAFDAFESLAENMRNFGCSNVQIRNIAFGSTPGFVTMALDAKQQARKNTGGRYIMDGGKIPRVMIDTWHLPSLGFLKLDVEGSEYDAIDGARDTIARCRPVILWEDKAFGARFGHDKQAVRHLLATLGYEHKARAGSDEIWTARA